jgi:hypothetical protein
MQLAGLLSVGGSLHRSVKRCATPERRLLTGAAVVCFSESK